MLNTNANKLINSNCLKPFETGKSQFHTKTLNAWAKIKKIVPTTLKEIINQNIWENKYVQIDNNPIKCEFLPIKNKNKRKNMKPKDLIEDNWKIATNKLFRTKII